LNCGSKEKIGEKEKKGQEILGTKNEVKGYNLPCRVG